MPFICPEELESLGLGLVLAAVWLIGSLEISGQYLMLAGQVVWFAFAKRKGHRGLAAQSAFLFALTGKAIWEWHVKLGRWW